MKAKLKKEFEGKGVAVHVQTRPGYARKIELDRATEKQLLHLLEMKHPAVTEDKSASK
jgi:hypothetical protein